MIDLEVLYTRDQDTGPPHDSPLHSDSGYRGPLKWSGPLTHDDVAAIAARVAYYRLPWWRRLVTRRRR